LFHDGITGIIWAKNCPLGIDLLLREHSIETEAALPEKSMADIRSFFSRVEGG